MLGYEGARLTQPPCLRLSCAICMHLARCPLPSASRLLLHSGSSRGRGICVGGGPLPATCLMGGGRGFFGVSAKVCAAPQRSNPCLPARLPPSLLLSPAVATLAGVTTDAERSTGSRGSTRRIMGATADAAAAVCGLAAARQHRSQLLAKSAPKARPPRPVRAARACSGRLVLCVTLGRLPAARDCHTQSARRHRH